jgi:hypothetical protein
MRYRRCKHVRKLRMKLEPLVLETSAHISQHDHIYVFALIKYLPGFNNHNSRFAGFSIIIHYN